MLFNTNGFMLEESIITPNRVHLSQDNKTIFRRLWWNWITR
ncbi:hypothetical protein ACNKHX_26870 [Shigella flexneri]